MVHTAPDDNFQNSSCTSTHVFRPKRLLTEILLASDLLGEWSLVLLLLQFPEGCQIQNDTSRLASYPELDAEFRQDEFRRRIPTQNAGLSLIRFRGRLDGKSEK